jgi:hypothetical protein
VRRNPFGLNRLDLVVVAACGVIFTAAIASLGRHGPPSGPPTEHTIRKLAGELGVTADQLRRAAEIVPPPARGEHLSPEQRDRARHRLAAVLNIPVERLDTVMRRRTQPEGFAA